jgi:DNA-binding SARP family transcriptional activator
MRLHLATAQRLELADGTARELAALDAALLAWLALEGPTPRARLAQLLWPDKDVEAARNSLRQRLFQLRRQSGVDLVAGSTTLSLADGVSHDLDEAAGVLHGVAAEDIARGEFAQWLDLQRTRRSQQARRALAERAEAAEQARDWGEALRSVNELLALDPLSEDAHRRLMRLHYLAGDRASALLAFDRCEQVLKDEVGTKPSAETVAVLDAIQRADVAVLPRRARPPAALLRPPRLVGRDDAWHVLADAAETGRPVLVEGEAGMGKSRLVSDFAARVPQASLTLSARPGDGAVPYASAARLVRSLVQRCGEPPAGLRHTLARLLPEWGESLGSPDDPRESARLHAAIGTMVGQAADAGVALIVLDDLHFADAASAEALCALADGEGAPTWVITSRPHEGSDAARAGIERLLAHGRARRVVLGPLGEAQVAELVDSLAVPGWSGVAMAPRLVRHTGGNPLFLLETLKSMPLDGGASVANLPAAATVTDLVGRRIGRLSPDAVKIARCAALAGEDFSAELATHLLGAGPLELADAWAELEAAQVLHEQSFAHDLIRDAARGSVPAPLARQLHAQIAQYLGQHGAPPRRIAAHWQASPQPHRAVPFLVQAGRDALRALRRLEAAQCYIDAADLLERGGDRGAAFDTLDEYFVWRRFPPDDLQEQAIDRLTALAETPLQRAIASEHRAGWLVQRGEFTRAGELAAEALGLFQHEQAPALAAALMVKLTGGHLQRGDNDEAVRTMYRAVALAEASDDDDAKQLAVGMLSTALNWAGRYSESEPHKVRAVELAKRSGRPIVIIDALIELAAARRGMGRIDLARAGLEQAEQLARSHDIEMGQHWPWFDLDRTRVALMLGDYTLALQRIEAAMRLLDAEMPSWRIAADNMATPLWMILGQWARAQRSAQAALARCEEAVPLYAAQAKWFALQVEMALHPVPDALARVDAALDRFGGDGAHATHEWRLLRSTLVDADDGVRIACAVRDEARHNGLLGVALDAELHACQAALRGADRARAAAHARAALALWSTVEPRQSYRAQIWLEAARALAEKDPDEQRRLVHKAARWVTETAQQRVPLEFRDSFLYRNPVNRELLELASRLRLPKGEGLTPR